MRTHAFNIRTGAMVDDEEAFDGRGTLKDGFGMRVPLTLQNSVVHTVHPLIADGIHDGSVRATVSDSSDQYGLNKPGSRFLTGDAMRAANIEREKAYADADAYAENAWRKTGDAEQSALSFVTQGGGYGEHETIGQRGLVCTPGSGDSRADDRADAYAAYDLMMANAWRKTGDAQQSALSFMVPGGAGNKRDPVGQREGCDTRTIDGAPGRMRMQHGSGDSRADAYADYDADMANAWRRKG